MTAAVIHHWLQSERQRSICGSPAIPSVCDSSPQWYASWLNNRCRIDARSMARREAGEQLVEDLGGQFHRDYGVVLRSVLFAVDSHAAKITAGLSAAGAVG